jgi:hypothetical protein
MCSTLIGSGAYWYTFDYPEKFVRDKQQLILGQRQLQRKNSNTDTRWRCVATMDAETWREFFAASKGDL